MDIYIKYKQDNGTYATEQLYNVLRYEEIPSTEGELGTTLGQLQYYHRFAKRNKYQIVISADELFDETKYNYIKNLYVYKHAQISIDNKVSWLDVMLIDDGDMPIDFLEDSTFIREVSLNFVDVEPITSDY